MIVPMAGRASGTGVAGMARRNGRAGASGSRTAAQNAGWARARLAATMADLWERFGTEEQCEEHMLGLKYPGGFVCERCGCTAYARVGGRREFRCAGCNAQFSATSGTVLAHTRLPLTKWFRAAWMVAMHPDGASAQAIARECGVSDVTGAAMARRLRTAMGLAMSLCRVGGDWVELDGAHVACGNGEGTGVRRPGTRASDAPVLVAVSASRCVMRVTSDSCAGTVAAFASAHVSRCHELRCDAHPAHAVALAGGWDVVSRPSAADGDSEASLPVVHHVISNLRSWLAGTFHGVTAARLQEYADQFSWRYSHRRGDPFAALLLEVARWPHQPLRMIRGVRVAMPAMGQVEEPGREQNNRLRTRWNMRRLSERRRREREEAKALAAVGADLEGAGFARVPNE